VHDPDDLLESLELVLGPAPRTQPVRESNISPTDERVIDLIAGGVAGTDDLLVAIDLAVGPGLAYLGELEMRGLIRPDGPGRYTVA
jgi:predicted Rossmann fold nucleotide-binding protein DprA/Smf involved in DNA uptake